MLTLVPRKTLSLSRRIHYIHSAVPRWDSIKQRCDRSDAPVRFLSLLGALCFLHFITLLSLAKRKSAPLLVIIFLGWIVKQVNPSDPRSFPHLVMSCDPGVDRALSSLHRPSHSHVSLDYTSYALKQLSFDLLRSFYIFVNQASTRLTAANRRRCGKAPRLQNLIENRHNLKQNNLMLEAIKLARKIDSQQYQRYRFFAARMPRSCNSSW